MSDPSVSDRVKCDLCGADNPGAHKFCGSCGAPLETEKPPSAQIRISSERESGGEPRDDAKPRLNSTPAVFEDSITNPNELSLFRSFRPAADDDEDWESEPSRLRLYIGVFVAVVVLGMVYLSWRTSRVSQNAHHAPVPPPVTAKKILRRPAYRVARRREAKRSKQHPPLIPKHTERALRSINRKSLLWRPRPLRRIRPRQTPSAMAARNWPWRSTISTAPRPRQR